MPPIPANKSIDLNFCIFCLTFRSVSICLLDLIRTRRNIPLDLKIPKAKDKPTELNQILRDLKVALHVVFDLRDPKILMAFEIVLLTFPIVAVPHFTVHEHGDLRTEEHDIRLARKLLVVLAIPQSAPPKLFAQHQFRLGVLALIAAHIAGDLLLGVSHDFRQRKVLCAHISREKPFLP